MDKLALVNKGLATTSIDPNDTRTPNQKRLDEIIEQNEEIICELQKMNKNLAIVGQALLAMAERPKYEISDKSLLKVNMKKQNIDKVKS